MQTIKGRLAKLEKQFRADRLPVVTGVVFRGFDWSKQKHAQALNDVEPQRYSLSLHTQGVIIDRLPDEPLEQFKNRAVAIADDHREQGQEAFSLMDVTPRKLLINAEVRAEIEKAEAEAKAAEAEKRRAAQEKLKSIHGEFKPVTAEERKKEELKRGQEWIQNFT